MKKLFECARGRVFFLRAICSGCEQSRQCLQFESSDGASQLNFCKDCYSILNQAVNAAGAGR